MHIVRYVETRQSLPEWKVQWRQVLAIADGHVFLFELVPALLGGWNLHSLSIQGESDWGSQTADQIAAWKVQQKPVDPCVVETTEQVLDWLRKELAKVDARLELLPADYEACPQCGFDHDYEQQEAAKVPHD